MRAVSETFRDKLKRLRKENDGAAPVEAAPALPEWWRARMARRDAHSRESDGTDGAREAQARSHNTAQPSIEAPRDVDAHTNAAGAFAARTTSWADSFTHGAVALASIDAAQRDTFALLTGDAATAELDPRAAVYLDIETTGLSGGAGTKAFLVGLGRFVGPRFELWQGFLREPDEERALLAECAERIRASCGVISFFGKSFDRHRLEDKMRVHGVRAPFDERPHLDLYHPCRRLFAAALPDARLATMERALCGVEREHDLPGSFAPAAWYDFLAGRPHLLEHVFRHNRDDVLSLVALFARLGRARDGASEGCADLGTQHLRMEWSRSAGFAAVLARAKRWDECALWAERAALSAPSATALIAALERAGDAWRRAGNVMSARTAWTRIADDRRDAAAARACYELARSGAGEVWYERAAHLAETNAGSPDMQRVLSGCRRARASKAAVSSPAVKA